MGYQSSVLEGVEMNTLDFYKGKTVLVTGDTGFKGSWLAVWLNNLGSEVIGFGLDPITKEDNYCLCDLEKKYMHITGDIRDHSLVLKTITEYKPDIIFHLAAQALVLPSFEDPYYTFDTNIRGTLNVLEAIRTTQTVKGAVMVTSDKCYRDTRGLQGCCEDDPLGGSDPYSASKSAAEHVIQSYIISFRGITNIASARAGNVIGGGDWAPYRIVPDCIRALRSNTPITIRNPDSTRPWQYILEPLYGYLILGKMLCHKQGINYCGAWNFGSPGTVTVKELVSELISLWGSGTIRETGNPDYKELRTLLLNSEKARNHLGWNTILPIRRALEFTISDYQQTVNTYNQRSMRIRQYMEMVK